MIVFCVEKESLKKAIKKEFARLSVDSRFINMEDPTHLDQLYRYYDNTYAIVTQIPHPHMNEIAWLDLLDSLSKRVPIVVVSTKAQKQKALDHGHGQFLMWADMDDISSILIALDICGALKAVERAIKRKEIPVYNAAVALRLFKRNGSLSVLSVHTSSFRKVAIEYGSDAYYKLQLCLQLLLTSLWGSKGSFRKKDILCRSSATSNTYFILLEKARSDASVPAPGALEKMADRLVANLQELFWQELMKPESERLLPSFLYVVPDFSVGYATVLDNPCIDTVEAVENLIENSKETSKVQHVRMADRRKELIQTLIQTEHLLIPFFQGVFYADKINLEDLKKSQAEKSIRPLADAIYSFESLIRVNMQKVDAILHDTGPIYLEAKHLRPDVLFTLAISANLALELDQACLKHAAHEFGNLPGKLMVNILPRNFYYIDQLKNFIPEGQRVIFEVSESEAINNFDLLVQAKDKLPRKDFSIAIDDFGKGYAGLDRIIKIQPDLIKLDRSLISDIDQDKPKRAFVKGLISAAKITNSTVLAEGIERIEEFKVLKELGIDLVQGFLFHKPMSKENLQEQLELSAHESEEPGRGLRSAS